MADTKPRAAAPVDGGSVRPEHGRGASVEGDGVSYRGIVWFVVILTATTLVCQLLMWGLLEVFQDRRDVPARSPVAAAVTERQASEGRVYPDMNVVGIAGGSQPRLLVNEPANLGHLVHGLVDEGKAVAVAAGVELHDDPWEMNVLATRRGSAHYPSMLEDVDARRQTEIELITGSLVREAKRHDVPVPLHAMLYALVKGKEASWQAARA